MEQPIVFNSVYINIKPNSPTILTLVAEVTPFQYMVFGHTQRKLFTKHTICKCSGDKKLNIRITYN